MLAVHVRSFLARHRAVHLALVVGLALGAGLIVLQQSRDVSRRAAAWGTSTTAWVAGAALEPGDPVVAVAASVPLAMVPERALTSAPTGGVALQRVGPGEILTVDDVGGDASDAVPVGWRSVAVSADDRSLRVSTGDHVDVVADGVVLAADGRVVSTGSSTVVVAVPADLAAVVAAAAVDGRAVLVGRT